MNKQEERKILYLTYDGLSDHIGQSQVLPYLLACQDKGINIGIVSFEKASKKEKVAAIGSLLEERGVEWHRIIFSEGGNFAKLKDFFSFVSTTFRVARRGQYRVIHSRSYFASTIALLLKIFLRKKIIFDKRDFWIDAKVETGRLDLSKFSHRFIHSILRFFERRLFLKSDHIISLTEKAKDIVLKKYPSRKPQDITVIPCCVDLSHFDPLKVKQEDSLQTKKTLGLENAFVLGYVGSIGPAYMIPQLFDCFQAISRKLPNARLLMMVNNDKEEVFKVADERGVEREKLVVASVTRDKMPLYISVLDCGIYFITPSYAKQATSPTKLSEMLALRKPVITNIGVGDVESIFGELKCGYLISEFTVDSYDKAADWLTRQNPVACNFDLSHYSLEYGAEKYFSVYNKILNG
jgi:glycosyltransferase involved in cell wall biosynthesis